MPGSPANKPSTNTFLSTALKGKTAVVTGAARGIGRAATLALAGAGANVAGLDICAVVDPRSGVTPSTPEDLAETGRLVETLGVKWQSHIVDQRNLPALRASSERIESSFGAVDILFANAGIQQFHPLMEMEDADWQGNSGSSAGRATVSRQNQQFIEDEAIERLLIQEIRNQQQQNAQERQDQESRGSQDMGIQGKLVKYTRALVWVGALQAFVLLLTIGAMYGQTSAAKNSERAWIIVSPTEYAPDVGFMPAPEDPLDAPGRGKGNAFICSFKNTGSTPARLIESAVCYRKIGLLENVPKEPDYGKRGSLDDLLLVKGDSIGAISPLYPEVILNRLEASTVWEGKAFLYAFGIVIYQDVYKRQHETRFGYVYHFPHGGDPRPRAFMREKLPPSYNRAT